MQLFGICHTRALTVLYPSLSPSLPLSDPEMQTIIDKLANFVARNGTEFERMTMNKQQKNPKFGFLFGGEHHAYYRWKVNMEQGKLAVLP